MKIFVTRQLAGYAGLIGEALRAACSIRIYVARFARWIIYAARFARSFTHQYLDKFQPDNQSLTGYSFIFLEFRHVSIAPRAAVSSRLISSCFDRAASRRFESLRGQTASNRGQNHFLTH